MNVIEQTWKIVTKLDGMQMIRNIESVGRTCYKSHDLNSENDPEKTKRFVKNIIDRHHESVLEHESIAIRIVTDRAILAELTRHRMASFCLSGDTEVYFDLPKAIKNGDKKLHKITLKELYKKWNSYDERFKIKGSDRIKNMNVRMFDVENKILKHTNIVNIFNNGEKDVYEIELEDGKKIKATKDHKFLSPEGFKTLEEMIDLKNENGKATFSKYAEFATNGIPCYQNKDWLLSAKNRSIENKTGLDGIAKEASIGKDCIRKWLKIHNIQFTKKEVASYTEIWNKNRYGYTLKPRKFIRKTDYKKLKLDDYDFRRKVCTFFNPLREGIFKKYNYTCQMCGKGFSGKIHLHHIKPVKTHQELAFDVDNVIPVHAHCHHKHHNGSANLRTIASKKMSVNFSKIKKIRYVGIETVYDLEVKDDNHNYIANGFVVHNCVESQRYVNYSKDKYGNEVTFVLPTYLKGIPKTDEKYLLWQESCSHAEQSYMKALTLGCKPEEARSVLPNSTKCEILMTANLREWRHVLKLRTSQAAHPMMRALMTDVLNTFKSVVPIVFDDIKGE